jgi:hypothetical protein
MGTVSAAKNWFFLDVIRHCFGGRGFVFPTCLRTLDGEVSGPAVADTGPGRFGDCFGLFYGFEPFPTVFDAFVGTCVAIGQQVERCFAKSSVPSGALAGDAGEA